MAKEEAKAVAKPAPVVPSGPWTSAKRGDVWVDGDGKDHVVIGTVLEGFDTRGPAGDECWRLYTHATRTEKDSRGEDVEIHFRQALPDSTVAAVSAWKKKGA